MKSYHLVQLGQAHGKKATRDVQLTLMQLRPPFGSILHNSASGFSLFARESKVYLSRSVHSSEAVRSPELARPGLKDREGETIIGAIWTRRSSRIAAVSYYKTYLAPGDS